MFVVYAIKSVIKNYIYVGLTIELNIRLKRHNNCGNKTTRAYAPFEVIHIKSFDCRREARKYEKYLKTGCGKEFLKTLVK